MTGLRLVGVSALLALTADAAWSKTSAETLIAQLRDKSVIVIAHRGCWEPAPENSIESIHRCRDKGIRVIELDVRTTGDGVLVLMHDETIDRTTTHAGAVAQLTYAELSSARLRSGPGGADAAVTEETVPTLAAALAAAGDDIIVNLDVKDADPNKVIAAVTAAGMRERVILKDRADMQNASSFCADHLAGFFVMPILDERRVARPDRVIREILRQCRDQEEFAFELIFSRIDYARLALEPDYGRGNVSWWVNTLRPEFSAGLTDSVARDDPDLVWGALEDMGFDLMQTDLPVEARTYLERRGANRPNDRSVSCTPGNEAAVSPGE